MVGLWGTKLLVDIRKRTHEYASDCAAVVREVCDEAKTMAGKVSPRVIESRMRDIELRVDRTQDVGKEASGEMRIRVRDDLEGAVRDPIRAACVRFVRAGNNAGPGVKQRILDLFNELADEAALGCEAAAQIILSESFEDVRNRISANIDDWGDPVDETLEALSQSHARKLRRSDAERRGRLDAALAASEAALEDDDERLLTSAAAWH